MYFLSLIIPMVLASYVDFFLMKWDIHSYRTYTLAAINKIENNPALWSNQQLKNEFTSILTKESFIAINDFNAKVYFLSSLSLNFVINGIFLAFIIDSLLNLTLIFSFLSCLVIYHLQRKKNGDLSKHLEHSKSEQTQG